MKSDKGINYEFSIGLEVHVQLKTKSKMFCGCSTESCEEANTRVCPVCLGYPGSLPVVNSEAVKLTVLTGLMLGCRINCFSKFDRKSYFYPDMPKNYQISQYDVPLCSGGSVEIDVDGGTKKVALTRIHLEEDVAKSIHFEKYSGVDFNRAGTPLMEIVSEPEMNSPAEAFAYLQALKEILLCCGVSECNLEEGNMRCDVNCSIRIPGEKELGTKAEIKNLNTFRGVHDALAYELSRQTETLSNGGMIDQETRRWDADAGMTFAMRSKEYAHDYRYFPDPDIPPVRLDKAVIEQWRSMLPELPRLRRERFVREFELPEYDAGVLVSDKATADFFEEAARISGNAKAVSNWVMTEMNRLLAETEKLITDIPMQPADLADLVALVEEETVSSTGAKKIFGALFSEGANARDLVEKLGVGQVSDQAQMEDFVDQAIAQNPESVEDYRAGKEKAAKYLIGQVMRLSKGKANPQLASKMIVAKLG